MKHVRSAFCLIILLRFLAPAPLVAQNVTKSGTTAAKFLSIPVGPRALGMGGAFVAVANDASAMYWNPGGMARITRSEALITHSDWIADIDFNYAGIVIPIRDFGVVGVNLTALTMGDMERTTEEQPDGTGEFFSAGSYAVGISYAQNLTEWFSIGANVKYVIEKIWNSTATGFAVDLGTLFTTPFPGLKFGAGISNFGAKMQMSGDDLLVQKDISPNQGNNPNINANLTTDKFDLPLNLRIGLSYEALSSDWHELLLVADATHPNDNSESVNVGAEYTFFDRIISLRAGYKNYGLREREEDLTFGGGIRYGITPEVSLKVDYAYESFGRLQNVHKIALGIIF